MSIPPTGRPPARGGPDVPGGAVGAGAVGPGGAVGAGNSSEDENTQRVLGGRYRLERIIGKGAMGRVWAAHDEVLNRSVAIKEVDLPHGMPRSEVDQIAQRTMREARAVASVSNPHVVTVFDMLNLPHGPAIVMELLAARSLAEIIGVDGPMSDSAAAHIGVAVATGLLASHSAGITHRDVKPANVLICDDGRIKLTDFGIARSAGEQTITATGLLLGSPAYISPEVAAGRPANAQSDAWGLGALLFACVQGVPPFDRGTPMATLTAVVQDPVPAHPNSGRLAGVIRGLLVKDPATRMSVGMAQQAMVRIGGSTDTPGSGSDNLVTHTWKPPVLPGAPSQQAQSQQASPQQVPPQQSGPQHFASQPTGSTQSPSQRSLAQQDGPQPTQPGPSQSPGSRSMARPAPSGSWPIPIPGARPPNLTTRPSTAQTNSGTNLRSTGATWNAPLPALPPPPWAGAGAASLRAIPVRAPERSPRSKRTLALVAVLVAIVAAAAGYFGVRLIAHLENGTPLATGQEAPAASPTGAGTTATATTPATGNTRSTATGNTRSTASRPIRRTELHHPARARSAGLCVRIRLRSMSTEPSTDTRAAAEEAASALARATGALHHDVALVMGSGWAPAADALGAATAEVAMSDLPGFQAPVVQGHGGTIRSIPIGGKRALVFLGRTHLYEGKGVPALAHGVRTAAAAGAKLIVLTNAAGGLRDGMRPGQPVLISDHLNLTAVSPIAGANFVDLTDLYSPRLRTLAAQIDPTLEEGVYAQLPGPHFETPAEIRMLRTLGADLVGMSTVLEAIAAREAGVEVFGLSLVTNLAAGMTGEPLNHTEVLAEGRAAAGRMGELLAEVVARA